MSASGIHAKSLTGTGTSERGGRFRERHLDIRLSIFVKISNCVRGWVQCIVELS